MASKDYTLDQALSEIEFLKNQWHVVYQGNPLPYVGVIGSSEHQTGSTIFPSCNYAMMIPKSYSEIRVLQSMGFWQPETTLDSPGDDANIQYPLVDVGQFKLSEFTHSSSTSEMQLIKIREDNDYVYIKCLTNLVQKDDWIIILGRIGGGVLRALQRLVHFITGGDTRWQALI